MKWRSLLVFMILFSVISQGASAISNQPINWGFSRSQNGQPADAGAVLTNLLKDHDSFYRHETKEKVLYLTFDNGYENGFTGQILDTLKKENVPATFFVTGHYLNSATDLVKRMVNEGHIVGNHSWSHPDMTSLTDEEIRNELKKVKEETARITKQKEMVYLRPPRGILSARTLSIAREEGYIHVMWSLAFVDWYTDQQKGSQYAYDNIMRQIHPGAIMLLHTVSKDNAEALPAVIKDLKKQGYRFESLSDLSATLSGIPTL
ncbi:delta-lactam-biosynthetic de-N-acetylase [Mangrovibacillus cuniculi]|uniref:Delta-lactam-biosynthetic de-N-acetylase n=1 Tax=Mangrovibacillus cuniculi TaxID=2593652 RepID=A0A7S8C994_9BACI|nr:delta-lactam-biosynthetic de-N-acetylase [Mangrovibacillus cuniculi]QPC45767.1 delta-lactam-biosynthetic de-N-acetylase [Mangrovibacillus cuniculi]